MSSRSRRGTGAKRKPVDPSVRAGLESLAQGNVAVIARMLDTPHATSESQIADELEAVMGVNSLSAEMLLARFFDEGLLAPYCVDVLNKSGKGKAATLAARIAAEWAKPSFVSTAKRLKTSAADEEAGGGEEADEEDSDWRTPLFFWRGRVALDPAHHALRWRGTWVAAASLPPAAAFAQSPNTFDLVTSKIHNDSALGREIAAAPTQPIRLYPATLLNDLGGTFKGTYLLDQGDGRGLRKFRDTEHRFAVKASEFEHPSGGDGPRAITHVGACGSTEFGRFVSLGVLEAEPGTGVCELTLARRYVDDSDSRAKWRDARVVVAKVESREESCMTPWDCLPWRLASAA